MGLDILVYYAQTPVLVASLLLGIAFLGIGKPWKALPENTYPLSVRRVTLGLGGVLVASIILTVIVALESNGLPLRTSIGEVSYLATFLIPLGLLSFIFVSLPLLSLLAKYGRATHLNLLLIALVLGMLWAFVFYHFPHNHWCAANKVTCVLRESIYSIGFLAMISSGFSIFARLPFRKK